MDWGIVASIIVALALFVLGMMTICVPIFFFMSRRMKKRMQTGNMPGCPMPCGPGHEGPGSATSQCASQTQ